MSRLELRTPNRTHIVMEELYKDLERRIESSPPGLCPVDMSRAFLELCHAQTCGKCVPCRIGLGQLNHFIKDVLDGNATMETLDTMEATALSIMESADCAIGYEAAHMVYKGLVGYRVTISSTSAPRKMIPAPIASRYLCVALCPAPCRYTRVYCISGRRTVCRAVRLIRKDNPFQRHVDLSVSIHVSYGAGETWWMIRSISED